MNILNIEDEDLAVRKLRKLVAEVDPSLTVQGVTASIDNSVSWLRGLILTHRAVEQIQPYFGNRLALTLKPAFDR